MRRRTFLRGGVLALGAPGVVAGRGFSGLFPALAGKTEPDGTIRLSSNENALGIPPVAREAIFGATLVIVLLFRPLGILGDMQRDKLMRKLHGR